MKIFLDTSALIKLNHQESGTQEIESLFNNFKITAIYLSELAKIEFTSTIWKKVRTKEISENTAKITITFLETDFDKFSFISIDSMILEQSRLLFSDYGVYGLRTLDAIQLSTAISLKTYSDLFIISDIHLKSFFEKEGLKTNI
ncbi:PIN_MT3492-like domain containing protein [Spirosomataceae bacterium]|jgi:predicted nucleic acid-binding protein